jgi:hypothetical protein
VTVRRAGIAVIAAIVAVVAPAAARPALAHHGGGGPVRLYLETVRLEPQGGQWALTAALDDTSSGKPAPGYLVQASGRGPEGTAFGPVSLADNDADGRYDAPLGTLGAGNWSVTVEVGDAPGGDGYVVPITRTWPVSLHEGQALDLTGQGGSPGRTASSGSGPSFVTPLLLGAALAALLGVTAVWLTRRRRTVVPAR